MTQTSWLDSHETAVAHINELLKHPATKEGNLKLLNQLRAQSGDQPLTMTEYLEVLENSKHGIYPWDKVAPAPFFQRLRQALRNSRRAFRASMRQ